MAVMISQSVDGVPENAGTESASRTVEVTTPCVSGPLAALAGWLVVALYNVVGIVGLPLRTGALDSRLLHIVVDFGQTMLLGLVGYALVFGWLRWGPKRPIFAPAAVALLAIVVFELVLPEDIEGFVERWTDSRGGVWAVRGMCGFLALAVPACFVAGRLVARGALRLAGIVVSIGLVVANDRVLVNGYHGAHVWIATCGATLFSASLAGTPLPGRLISRVRPRARVAALAALSVLSGTAALVQPPGRVLIEILQRDTAFLAPALTALHASSTTTRVEVPSQLAPWFASRATRPDVPPSAMRLLPDGPIVVLVTIDALRMEVLSRKNARVAPTLHRMRKDGVYFSQARSFGSDTRYSIAALFSGRYFSMLKWTRGRPRPTLERDVLPQLPELLSANGVETVLGNTLPRMFSADVGILGTFSEEFVTEDGEGPEGTPAVVDAAIERLRRHGSGPLFYYAHLLDPHGPYLRHGKRGGSSRSAYLSEVSHADKHLGRLRSAIRELGLAHRTLLIVASDHGEAFGEHGLYRHNKPLYEVMVHVPMFIEYPGMKPRTIDRHVSLMDIGATVLDVFGVTRPGYWMSETLVPLLHGDAVDVRRPIFMGRPKENALLFGDGIKVLWRKSPWTEEIYDLKRDPDEEEDLRDSLGAEGDRRVALAQIYLQTHTWPNGDRPTASR